jgi:hypothetical protein
LHANRMAGDGVQQAIIAVAAVLIAVSDVLQQGRVGGWP